MPWQLVYTSAPRGLLSGQSGFCTVARSADLREALVQRLEQISSYHYLRVADVQNNGGNPTICAFRILDIRGAKYQVLTRIVPCGLDFTARTNHLAHHLILQPVELAQLPSPAALLRHWGGWLASWQGEARFLEDVPLDDFAGARIGSLPAQTWLRATGDAGRAAGLLESECVRGCYLVCPPGGEGQLLDMFGETLQLLDLTGQYPLRPWRHTFTTFLQGEDNPADFQWRGCQEGTPAYQQAVQRSATILTLRAVRVPANSLVKVAREGQRPLPASTAPATAPAGPALRRELSAGRPAPPPAFDTSHLTRVASPTRKSNFLDLNISIDSSSLTRVAIFLAVLLTLVGLRLWLKRHQARLESQPVPVRRTALPAAAPALAGGPGAPREASQPIAPPDPRELDRLWADGPTFLVMTTNLKSLPLPIGQISCLQNLLRRFDTFDLLPGRIQLRVGAGQWDSSAEEPMPINGRARAELSAGNDDCVLDYSAWLSRKTEPVMVRTKFDNSGGAVSMRFEFASTNDGWPFRLLLVDSLHPPAPLPFAKGFVQSGRPTVGASLQPSLAERLRLFHLVGGETWWLRPFVKTKDGNSTRYLYADWPPEDLPESELDFGEARARAAQRQERMQADLEKLKQGLELKKKLIPDFPLGAQLGLAHEKLASFARYAESGFSARRFIKYLGEVKTNAQARQAWVAEWPRLREQDEPGDLKFQLLYASLTNNLPGAQHELFADDGNCLPALWRSLKELDEASQEEARASSDLARAQELLASVPADLAQTDCVGLFIVDRRQPRPGVEMARFQGR